MIPAQKNNGNEAQTKSSVTLSVQEAREVPVDPVDGRAEGESKRTKNAIAQRKYFPANNKGDTLPGQADCWKSGIKGTLVATEKLRLFL